MGVKSNIEKSIKQTFLKKAVDIIHKKPEENVDKLFELIKKVTKDKTQLDNIDTAYNYYKTDEATNKLVQNILKNTDKKCLEKFFINFLTNANWFGAIERAKYLENEDTKIPFTILLSPTMECNLRCNGCYAENMLNHSKINIEEVDRIVKEARELGIYYIIILGGEPFFYKELLGIYEKYNDVMFSPFTNGTLIDEITADRLQKCGNVFPMLSVEGSEKDTDERRGKGVYKKVMRAMDILNEKGILFGVSTAVTSTNINSVLSDEFVEKLINKGSKMNWYFLFMPVGGETSDFSMMLTAEQRAYLGKRTKEIRETKPYFTIDFFNDAPYVGGCIAGKYYCHINVNEDVEPCVFAHFSNKNIKGVPLIEAFRDPFFKEIRHRQPYDKNMLRPCMMIDNPQVVKEICEKVGAKPTNKGGVKMLKDKDFNKKLDNIANEWKPYADREWKKVFNEKGNDKLSKG
ncbi:radical SAM protein [Clostridium grantii]|uniref:Radical SAM superfamily enzyme, MoaA/NifB/PqqE/SkfB family n=1 Tax=Clostridium grantii DSM 8605 TaxID=1121316 RepID=A0A1M5XC74_9CLOT|nr:radical SAM protein [Clostridium grantii]SHH97467.1 Radical SAM superfamily enzyme, MoaA/NifB/PqqE/SkfB family [Clostridium grantii DSM 8605]